MKTHLKHHTRATINNPFNTFLNFHFLRIQATVVSVLKQELNTHSMIAAAQNRALRLSNLLAV